MLFHKTNPLNRVEVVVPRPIPCNTVNIPLIVGIVKQNNNVEKEGSYVDKQWEQTCNMDIFTVGGLQYVNH